jgi:phage shock protein A
LKARAELADQHDSVVQEQQLVRDRVTQMEQDMLTLKSKLADAKVKLKGMYAGKAPNTVVAEQKEKLTPGERKIRRAMGRFDRLQAQVENLEARVRSYEVGGPTVPVWGEPADEARDPLIEEELEKLKRRVSGAPKPVENESQSIPEHSEDTTKEA